MYNAVIVEDDLAIMSLDQRYLKEYKLINKIYTFRRADEALDFVLKNNIDVIILDYHLPDSNGDMFLQRLREARCFAEVIVTTIDTDLVAAESMLSYGVIDFLVKPFTKQRFCEAVDSFLRIAPGKNEKKTISQDDIDVYIKKARNKPVGRKLSKGLQQSTYDRVFEYVKTNALVPIGIETMAKDTGLSKVTLRRYMNDMHENNIINIKIDYETGGRPSILYYYNQA